MKMVLGEIGFFMKMVWMKMVLMKMVSDECGF